MSQIHNFSFTMSIAGDSPRAVHTPLPDRLFSFTDGDVVLRSSNNVDFQVHKLILRESSPFFRDMFSLPQKDPQPAPIQVDEDSRVINNLLKLVYPTEDGPDLPSIQDVLALLRACEKYQVKCASNPFFSLAMATRLSAEPPVRAWAIATRFNLASAGREAIPPGRDAVRRWLSELRSHWDQVESYRHRPSGDCCNGLDMCPLPGDDQPS